MQKIRVTGESPISFRVLKDYHTTAEVLHDLKLKSAEPLDMLHVYTIDLEAEDEADAKEIFLKYLHRLDDMKVANHAGHLAYITQAIIENEGSYISEAAVLNDKALPHLQTLLNLLKLESGNDLNKLKLDIAHTLISNQEFSNYTSISNPEVIQAIIREGINAQFKYLLSQDYSYDISNSLKKLTTPTIEDISSILEKASTVTSKAFKMQLLYTVCDTLLRYLNDWSPLNPNKVKLTNDQARVLYYTCELHGLLTRTHEIESEAVNYIRMVLKNDNNSNTGSMLAYLTD